MNKRVGIIIMIIILIGILIFFLYHKINETRMVDIISNGNSYEK